MHVDVTPPLVTTQPGRKVSFEVTVHNDSDVINAYRIAMLGVDPAWVTTDHDALSLFPDQMRSLTVTLAVPRNYPAGHRELAIQVTSLNDQSVFGLTQVGLEVEPVVAVSFELEPSSASGGKRTKYTVVVANTGNTRVDFEPTMIDDEEICRVEFEPESTSLEPTEQRIFEAGVKGKRPWLGTPAVRTLRFGLDGIDPPPVERLATFIQRPRIGRWLLSLLGLMAAAAVFATVLSRAFSDVIDEAQVDPDIIESALAEEEQAPGVAGSGSAADFAAAPAISGNVTVRGTDSGISGVTIELFGAGNALVPVSTAATDAEGAFTIGGLKSGNYKLRITAAGFGEIWYDRATSFEAGAEIEVAEDDVVLVIELGGEPGSIKGLIVAEDPSGAQVRLAVPGELLDSTVDAEVELFEVTATGTFEFFDVPAPATYELTVSKPGFAIQRQVISLSGGESRDRVEIVLLAGAGQISGSVSADGAALGGVTVSATDGTNTFQTVSLTTADGFGTFVLRELATPATYTVTFSRDGFQPASQTVSLVEGGTQPGVNIVLSRAAGAISGTAFTIPVGGSTPVVTGGITVTATNGADTFITSTVSQATTESPIGSYAFFDIPAPDVYTVTFSGEGLVSQTRSVNVDGATAGVDATLAASTAVLRGSVSGALTAPGVVPAVTELTGGVSISVTDGATTFLTDVADDPLGQYELVDVAPGTYTVTFDRQGSQPVTQIVSLVAGEVEVLDVVIGRQALISGTLTFDGSPAPDAGVRLFRIADFPAGDPVATTTTDANGAFVFPALDAPQIYVVVFAATPAGPAVDSVTVELDPGEQFTTANGML